MCKCEAPQWRCTCMNFPLGEADPSRRAVTLSPACSGGPEDAVHKSAAMKTWDSTPQTLLGVWHQVSFYLNILVSVPFSGKIRSRIYNLLCQEKLALKNLFLSRAGHVILILHLISDWQGKLVKNKVIEYLPHVKFCGYWDEKMNKMKLYHLILFITFHLNQPWLI